MERPEEEEEVVAVVVKVGLKVGETAAVGTGSDAYDEHRRRHPSRRLIPLVVEVGEECRSWCLTEVQRT